MKKLILAALILLSSCVTGDDETVSTANKAGITNVQVRGLSFTGCGENDKMGKEFAGTNAAGQPVEGVICCGNFKRCTIRY